MGNNQAFTDFEATVLATYNKGVLDKDLLSTFMERYRGVDIDSGGKTGTLSKDGLDIEGIVFKIFEKAGPAKPVLPQNHKTWTSEQDRQNEEYWDARYEAFSEISRGKFGWG